MIGVEGFSLRLVAWRMLASYWNAVNHSSGHVSQGRYYSCPLDEGHLWEASLSMNGHSRITRLASVAFPSLPMNTRSFYFSRFPLSSLSSMGPRFSFSSSGWIFARSPTATTIRFSGCTWSCAAFSTSAAVTAAYCAGSFW